jgi:hypothetical protein
MSIARESSVLVSVNNNALIGMVDGAGVDQIVLDSEKAGSVLALDDLSTDSNPSSVANVTYGDRKDDNSCSYLSAENPQND